MEESQQFKTYQETLRAKNAHSCNALLSRLVKYHGDAFMKVAPVVVIEAPPEPKPARVEPSAPPLSECVTEIEEGPRRPSIQEIKKSVCRHFNVTLADIESPRRTAAVVRPRQIVYYLCRKLTSRSLPEIGRRLGNRDHTSVLSGARKVSRLMEIDRNIAQAVTQLEAQFQ